ncbi:Bifunctional uridylyltransferase/uridylyl-removing enzyme [Acidobacteriia bacterium SbA2]|nr:Bifunctional uridylyltransferase/uridylyl-removing enzyme [Acidobacteriia bacterium SbA2]
MDSGQISAFILSEHYSAESLRIQQTFDCPGDGLAVLRGRSDVVDTTVGSLYRHYFSPQSEEPRKFCILALGGYGRRELFPHSDIDLLFLTESSAEQGSQRMAIAAILRELWDMRLRVGHSVHTLAECGRLYRDNLEFNVSLLDCRYLAGDPQLFNRLHDDVYPHLVARDHQDLLRNLAEMTRQRHTKYGNTVFHLEPNLKEAPGGLRDYHVCRWLARISALEKHKTWSAPEELWPAAWRTEIGPAWEFLCAARCFLHYFRERDDNQLTYECQDLACVRGIGFPRGVDPGPSGPQFPPPSPEEWMRAYFRRVRSIYQLTVDLLDDYAPSGTGLYALFRNWRSRLSNADFSVLRERVYFRQPAAVAQDPALVLRLFELVARHGLELSREAERVVAEALTHGAINVLSADVVWRHFRQILCFPEAAKALRDMHRLGVLRALFPEFQAIDSLVIRDFFHRYTVDEHSFMTIQNLHALSRSRRPLPARHSREGGNPKEVGPRFRGDDDGRETEWEDRLAEILEELEQPELLYLALLFHDVGKGMETADHVEGSRQALDGIMARLELSLSDCATVRFLILNHLEMSNTLQRRDIFEPETVRAFAEKIETSERLKMLSLMTYADIKSVNPEALTPWKTELLWELYASTANYLARSADDERLTPAVASASAAERVLPLLPPSVTWEKLDGFLEGLPRRYLATHSPEEVTLHFDMAERLGAAPAQVHLKVQGSLHELTVLTPDRPFLFASITGALAAWGMSIVKADAFANAKGVVLDTFRFADLYRTLELNPSEADRLKSILAGILEGKMELAKLLSGRLHPATGRKPKVTIPTKLRFDDSSSSHSTLLELVTQDRPGLLYQVSSILAELGCNIEIALIDTEGEKAIDVFYLTAQGGKLPPELQRAIETALLK